MSADQKTTKNPKTGQPEKNSLLQRALVIGFFVLAVGAIAWMVIASPPEKRLVCSSGAHSLNSFGSCHEE
jgi:hypothetical protein